jgi:hypothetical protein
VLVRKRSGAEDQDGVEGGEIRQYWPCSRTLPMGEMETGKLMEQGNWTADGRARKREQSVSVSAYSERY